jgi:transposase-like protein/IS1 family transposase
METCPTCQNQAKRNGSSRRGRQRFFCKVCKKSFSEKREKLLNNMYLPEEKALLCLQLLVEGNSLRATERIANVSHQTVLDLLETVGKKCLALENELIQNIEVKRLEADEIWAFIQMKNRTKHAKGLPDDMPVGSAWTFVALEAETKMVVAWHLGRRTEEDTLIFLEKVYQRISHKNQFQLTTDAWRAYGDAVSMVLGTQANYGQVIKTFRKPVKSDEQIKYSQSQDIVSIEKASLIGRPNPDKISTSLVERQNLTMRMSMRRLTRLTNGFSKKKLNLEYALALHFCYYNFCRVHKTIRCTPAMEAGLVKHLWTLKDLLRAATPF